MASAVPDWLRGLWKRLSIDIDGQRDTTTEVFYLQTPTCFGDLRIPGDRPDLKQASFSSLSPSDAIALSRQQGFSGIAQFKQKFKQKFEQKFEQKFGQGNKQGVCQWKRAIDYQPPQSVRDIGLLYWENDILIEEGIDQSYREEWQKVEDGDGDYTALVLTEEDETYSGSNWQASLVIAGDYFVYSQNRSFPLPVGDSLTDCLMRPATAEKQQEYLACEISFGLCRSGPIPWKIQRSTIPWREGSALWSSLDWKIDLENRKVVPMNGEETRAWQIWEWGTGKAFKA